MRDARLDHEQEVRLLARVAAASAVLTNIGHGPAMRCTVARWAHRCLVREDLARFDFGDELAAEIGGALADALDGIVVGGELRNDGRAITDAGVLLVAQSLGPLAARIEPDEDYFRFHANLVAHPVMGAALEKCIERNVAMRSGYGALLAAHVAGSVTRLAGQVSDGIAVPQDPVDRTRDPFGFLDSLRQPRNIPRGTYAGAWRMLASIRPTAWIDALDGNATGWWTYWMIAVSRVENDADLIVELLRSARPAVAANGTWTGSIGAIAMVMTMMRHLAGIDDALDPRRFDVIRLGPSREAVEGERTAFRMQEAPWRLACAWKAILDRSDGVPLAISTLAWLTNRHLQECRRRDATDWSLTKLAIDLLATVLAIRGVRLDRVRRVFVDAGIAAGADGSGAVRDANERSRGDRCALSHLLAAAFVTHAAFPEPVRGGPATVPFDDAAALIDWFDEILTSRDGGIDALIRSRGDDLATVGRLLGYFFASTDAASSWHRLWIRLEPQRQRLAYAWRDHDTEVAMPSELLILVGLFACAFVEALGTENRVVSAQRLLAFCWDAVRRVIVLKNDWGREDSAVLSSWPFDFANAVLKDRLPITIEPWVRWLKPDPVGSCFAAEALQRNGVPVPTIEEIFRSAGVDIVAACERVAELEQALPPRDRSKTDRLAPLRTAVIRLRTRESGPSEVF